MKKQKLVRIREIDDRYLYDPSEMIQFSDLFEADNFIVEHENNRYELIDYYCKNKDCDCTDASFVVMLNGQDTNEILSYDYEKGELNEPSEYAFLLDEIGDLDEFDEILKYKHDIVKSEFEAFRLKNKVKELQEEVEQLKAGYYEENPSQKTVRNDNKIGRNAPCPCGSGKKYKKCCLKS